MQNKSGGGGGGVGEVQNLSYCKNAKVRKSGSGGCDSSRAGGGGSGGWMCTKNKCYCENAKKKSGVEWEDATKIRG